MPSPIISSFANKSGKSEKEVERLWNDTQKIVKREYPDKTEEDFYRLVVGILKKRLGIEEEDAAITTTSMGGAEAQYRTKVLPMTARFGTFDDLDNWGRTTSDVGPKKKKKKSKNESIEQAIEYLNKKINEVDSPEIQKHVKDYAKAEKELQIKAAQELKKDAKFLKGAAKKKQMAAAKVIELRKRKFQMDPHLTSDDILAAYEPQK